MCVFPETNCLCLNLIIISKYTLECTQLSHIKKLHNVTRKRKRDVLQYLPIISKIVPLYFNIDFYP